MALVGTTQVLVPLGSLIDKPAELARLTKEIDKTQKDLTKEEAKLANAEFLARAPKPVVDEVHRRVADFQQRIDSLAEQRKKVTALPD